MKTQIKKYILFLSIRLRIRLWVQPLMNMVITMLRRDVTKLASPKESADNLLHNLKDCIGLILRNSLNFSGPMSMPKLSQENFGISYPEKFQRNFRDFTLEIAKAISKGESGSIKVPRVCLWCSIFIFCMTGLSVAQTMNIEYVIENGAELDGKEITVEGEAVGHLMQRGEFAWVNINDKTECIGIWANYVELEKIQNLGKYVVTGDWIRVFGILNNRCPTHGGDTDIHASSVVVITEGSPRHIPYDQRKANVLIFFIGVLACLYIIKISKRRR